MSTSLSDVSVCLKCVNAHATSTGNREGDVPKSGPVETGPTVLVAMALYPGENQALIRQQSHAHAVHSEF